MSRKYVAGRRVATSEDMKDFKHFVENELGGKAGLLEQRAYHQKGGMNYVQTHRKELSLQFGGEWIAATEGGVVAHASERAVLNQRLLDMAQDLALSSHEDLVSGGVYIEYCERQQSQE